MPPKAKSVTPTVFYRTLNVEGLEIFYREAGPRDALTVMLLHGFPSSSHMFRNLIPMLADKYHVVAPDFPGYGESSTPSVDDFDYSFERLASVTYASGERHGGGRTRASRPLDQAASAARFCRRQFQGNRSPMRLAG